jgi:flagellar export protein FliJ
MAFTFRFQRLLDYRCHQVDMEEMQLAEARRRVASGEAALARLTAGRDGALRDLARCLHEGLSGEHLQIWRLYLSDLEMRIHQQARQVEVMKARAEEVRVRLVEAFRRKRAMERLRTREERSWRENEDRRAENELAEQALQRRAGRFS